MLSANKRAAKYFHYYQTDIEFKKIIDDERITYNEVAEYIDKNYSDLNVVYSEIRAFDYGRKNYNVRCPIEIDSFMTFFNAGLKLKT